MNSRFPLAAAVASLIASPALADDSSFNEDAVAAMKGDIVIEAPYGVSMKDDEIIVFMTIHNSAKEADVIESVSSDAAEKAGFAKYNGRGEDRKTVALSEIDAPANDAVMLDQDGYHVVLTELKEPVEGGDIIPLVLKFAETGDLEVQVSVAVLK